MRLWLRSRLGLLEGFSRHNAQAVALKRTILASAPCGGGFSATDFFKDSSWLNVPKDRLGEILVEPLYPRGGLLGGASKQDGAPKSKLAALAAARKKKENQKTDDGQTTSSVALLDKLGGTSRERNSDTKKDSSNLSFQSATAAHTTNVQTWRYPARQPKDIAPPQAEQPLQVSAVAQEPLFGPEAKQQAEIIPVAAPSAFAQTIAGSSLKPEQPVFNSLPHYALQNSERHTEFSFAGPSPDDVVVKAQNTKGASQKAVKQQTKPANDDKSIHGVTQAVGNTSLEDTKVKGKNLDVLAEFEKSKPKNAANFVVIGTK